MSYRYIPELDFYFESYWSSRGEITTDNISIPVIDSENQDLPSGSFIELLFSQTFDSTSYTYLFEEIEISDLSKTLEERLKTSYSTMEVYTSVDSTATGENIFSISSENIILLDKLLSYRRSGNTNLSDITYANLNSTLSKLIYVYLDLVVNNNYTILNDNSVASEDDNILENLFELYVVNESHKLMKSWTTLLDADLLELRLVHEVKNITSTIESAKEVSLNDIVYDYNIDVYHNGDELTLNTDYTLMIDTTSEDSTAVVTWVVWEDTETNIVEEDVLVIEYFTKVNQNDTDTNAFVDGEEFQSGG
jgi:hypothetical protein